MLLLKLRLPADLVDASGSHRWSMDSYIPRCTGFLGASAVPEIFISIDGRVEKWRVWLDYQQSTDGPSMGIPWANDGHLWDPVESWWGLFMVNLV